MPAMAPHNIIDVMACPERQVGNQTRECELLDVEAGMEFITTSTWESERRHYEVKEENGNGETGEGARGTKCKAKVFQI